MPVHQDNYVSISRELKEAGAVLVAVSKTKPIEDIRALYALGQRDFGENYVQELMEKQPQLPADIRWHFIGHLQSNKVKYITPFVHLVQGVDSIKLLKEINKQAEKLQRPVQVLLQVHIAREETKFGLDEQELSDLLTKEAGQLPFVKIKGLMGMASFTGDEDAVRNEFRYLKKLFDTYAAGRDLSILSMGMSGDYRLALEEGSNMVRIGSLLFGAREKV